MDRCAECVCMECWSLAVYSLHCWTHPNRVGPSRQFRALYFFAEPVEIQRKKVTHFSEDLCVRVYLCVQECIHKSLIHTYLKLHVWLHVCSNAHLPSAFVCILHVWLHWFSESIVFICSSCEEGGNTDEERD